MSASTDQIDWEEGAYRCTAAPEKSGKKSAFKYAALCSLSYKSRVNGFRAFCLAVRTSILIASKYISYANSCVSESRMDLFGIGQIRV